MQNIPRLTDLEISIMKVLWEHGMELTIQEIANHLSERKLSVASITQAMKHLVTKEAVVVKQHVLVSNVYARTFIPCFDREEFLAAEFKRLQKSVFGKKKINLIGIVAALLDSESDMEMSAKELKKLQDIIDNGKLDDKEI